MISILFTHIGVAVVTLLFGAYLTVQVLRGGSVSSKEQGILLFCSVVTIFSGGVLTLVMNSDLLHACTNLAIYSVLLTAMHIVVFTNKKLAYVLPVATSLSIVVLLLVF